jgi:hypothetical protein
MALLSIKILAFPGHSWRWALVLYLLNRAHQDHQRTGRLLGAVAPAVLNAFDSSGQL